MNRRWLEPVELSGQIALGKVGAQDRCSGIVRSGSCRRRGHESSTSCLGLQLAPKRQRGFHKLPQCSARSWSAAVLCRFRQRVAFAKRQRTAALQDGDALAAAPFRLMAPMRVQFWRLKLSMDRIVVTPTFQSARLAGWKTEAPRLPGSTACAKAKAGSP